VVVAAEAVLAVSPIAASAAANAATHTRVRILK
jgi:hypothetical protein